MWHFSLFCCFFIIILTPQLVTPSTTIGTVLSVDKINQTCTKCAEMSTIFSYDVCLTSLQAVPASHATNLQGLALVAMELAIQNATASICTIKELVSSGSFDPFETCCLMDCLEEYSCGVVTLIEATGAFLTGKYEEANVWVSSVMDAATTCEDGFTDRQGHESPLKKENYFLFQLCDIALCIFNLLSAL
ncbi:hypothetical protein LWI28_004563 [Acer negundo]|uniref:Pectinesterase inhibitor domain-containing protein n=1 Tax=Acer negundo TaxID=4023 RepID=A0AAD5IU66_ACENE|nr:hypothetical protein LWI28_004563 [Acer negundo]